MQNLFKAFLPCLLFPFFFRGQYPTWINSSYRTMISNNKAHSPIKAGYYTLRSIDGKKASIHVEELPHELRISCLHDTSLLYEYFGDFQAIVLDSSFLRITYAVRGGSGFGSENTVLLAIRDGHLHQALLIMSSFLAVGFNYHHTLHTDLKLSGGRGSNYILTAGAREYLKDESHPAGSYKRFKPILLRFNSDLMAFHSKMPVANTAFTAVEVNHGNEYINFAVGDTIPMVHLAGYLYYYAEGSWYSPIDAKLLLQEDTVIDKVLKLSIVQQRSVWVDSVTCHRHGISLMMLETADWPSDTGHYILQVGYHSRQKFDPYYLFKVCQPNLAIETDKTWPR